MIETGETVQPGCDLSDPGPTKYNIISPTLHSAAGWATHPARKNLGKFTKCNWRFSSPKLNYTNWKNIQDVKLEIKIYAYVTLVLKIWTWL